MKMTEKSKKKNAPGIRLLKTAQYSEDDYLYGSARLRALERNIIGSELCARLCEAEGEEFTRQLCELLGISGEDELEDALKSRLEEAYALTASLLPERNRRILDIYRCPYDCHNLKYILKCEVRGRDPSPGLSACGTVHPDIVTETLHRDGIEALGELYPANMGEAIYEARERMAQTRDPQTVDFILDAACFADMKEAADETGVPFISKAAARRTDQANLMTALRISRMTGDPRYRAETFTKAFLPGGKATAAPDGLLAVLTSDDIDTGGKADGELARAAGLTGAALTDFTEAAAVSPGAAERVLEDRLSAEFSSTRYKLAGAEVYAAYLNEVETSVKNLRIIAAGKHARSDPQQIRERLRACMI